MKRRNFLKGFLAATGTLAVAPALVLEPVQTPFVPSYEGIMVMMSTVEPFEYNNLTGDLFTAWAKDIFRTNDGERVFISEGQVL